MEMLAAKHLLTPVRGSMDGFFYADWNMNLYRGCSHGCIYCDSRSVCYRIDRIDTVRPKANAISLLEDELRARRSAGVITMGSMSDPYNPLERDFPGVRSRYLQRYGNAYELAVPDAERLYEAFRSECERLRLHWRFSDINREMFARMPQQTSFLEAF